MALRRMNKLAALSLAAVMAAQTGLTSFVPLTAQAKEAVEAEVVQAAVNANENDKFTWDNATVYFVLTDRFYNGNTGNDHSYGRSVDEVDAASYASRLGTFHGGDLAGMTKKIEEGYFDNLGVNVIWISAPYEQAHGAICAQISDSQGFKHYPYHGYYALDFSQLDANMGTEDEMAAFVKSAHSHGIRVVYDVVMNHVGYADPVTVTEYGAGTVTDQWKDIYYNTNEKDYRWYMDYTTETENGKATLNSTGDWSGWWSSKWVRAIGKRFQGYEGSEDEGAAGGPLKVCTGGLPDIKTEDSSDNGVPPILVSKWKKEGRYDKEMQELDSFFSEYGISKRNVNYVVKWLSDYVEQYGIDGFRCDTAKHVENEHWATLHKVCQKRLEKWRAAEAQKPESERDPAYAWDENFWMTGEVYDWSNGGKSDYFTSGAFDSLINFGFQGVASQQGESLEATYSNYARSVNGVEGYNMLSYIASHDKGFGYRGASSGTALLLCPGAVQIYYGDEYGRGTQGDRVEQNWRSQMEFGKNEDNLKNWQKIGQFRNNHPSVGAGTHTKLSGSVYTFSRTYHLGEADEDKVVVALPTKSGTFDVNVGDIFADGETITDAYSGETYTVSGGSVSATCDGNGVILLEGSGQVNPAINAKLTSGSLPYKTETIKIKLSATMATDTYYSVNDSAPIAFKDGDTIEIGGGAAYDEVTTVKLTGKGEDGSDLSKELTYAKCSEPAVSDGSCAVKVAKSEFATSPYCYAYDAATNKLNGAWPGGAMEDDGDYWSFTPSEGTESFFVILSDSSGWRSTPDGVDGLTVSGAQLYTKSTNKLTDLPSGEPAKVNVKYVDEAGNVLKEVYRVGAVGATYETSAATIKGCTLKTKPDNATGTYTKEEITVTYVYSGSAQDITPIVSDTPEPTGVTGAPEPTGVTGAPEPTGVTGVPEPTGVTNIPSPIVGDAECIIAVSGDKNGITLSADVEGMEGTVRYMFTYEKDGKEYLIKNFQSESTITWVPKATGKYTFNLYVIQNGNIISDSNSYNVR